MPRSRAVGAARRPFKHVELDEGDWIDLKQKLDYGESSDLYDATYRSNVGTGDRSTTREVRMTRFNIDRILIYTMRWSFIDDEQKPIPLSADGVRSLDFETSEAIHKAINDIEAENARASETQVKNGRNETASPRPSPGSSTATPASPTPLGRSE